VPVTGSARGSYILKQNLLKLLSPGGFYLLTYQHREGQQDSPAPTENRCPYLDVLFCEPWLQSVRSWVLMA